MKRVPNILTTINLLPKRIKKINLCVFINLFQKVNEDTIWKQHGHDWEIFCIEKNIFIQFHFFFYCISNKFMQHIVDAKNVFVDVIK